MNDEAMFHILSHLDKPARYIGLTMDDCLIGGVTIVLMMMSSSKIVLVLIGIVVRTFVRRLKKGNPPHYLLLLMYWNLPHAFTRFFLRGLPQSNLRYWVSQKSRGVV